MKMTKFVAIASAKGGVGKTTTAIGLGVALSSYGRDVTLIDGNLTNPNIGLFLGVPILAATLHDVLAGKKHISEATYLHPSGLKLVTGSLSFSNIDENAGGRLKGALRDLNGATEIAIIDTAATLGKHAADAIKAADELIVVTSPDMPSVTDALKTIKLAEENGVSTIGIVLNKVKNDENELSAENVESILEKTVIGIIPHDDNVRKALFLKHPVAYVEPNAPASAAFRKLASLLVRK